jgi:peptide-methionine (S)-S-oxide reductase
VFVSPKATTVGRYDQPGWNVLTTVGIDQVVSSAIFAAGCFWGVEAAFREIPGVTATAVGYTGGTTENPSYKQVCTGRTGHAEAVRIEFDPDRVSYDQLLDTFWQIHDPTTKNRQGWDIGTQYRSAIFFTDPQQQASAATSLHAQQAEHRSRIVTEITPASAFYPAEEYHQRYLEKRGQASCHIGLKPDRPVIGAEPKVQGGSSLWQKLLKTGSSKT